MKGAGVISPGETDVPYPAFILVSITLWGAFYDAYKNCSLIFQNYAKILLVNKIPIIIIIISEMIISLIKFIIPFILILVYFFIKGIPVSGFIVFLPVALIPLLMLGGSVGLVFGLLGAIARDFGMLSDNVMRLMMFLSPVVYAPDISRGLLGIIVKVNPLTYLISSCRDLIFEGHLYQDVISIIVMVSALTVFMILVRFFISNISRILERADL